MFDLKIENAMDLKRKALELNLRLLKSTIEVLKKEFEGENVNEVRSDYEDSNFGENVDEVRSDNEDYSDVCTNVDDDGSSIDPFEAWGEDPGWAKESKKRERIEKSLK